MLQIIAAAATTTTTTTSLKSYQLPIQNNAEMVVVYILKSSKSSGAIFHYCWSDTTLCSTSFVLLFLPGLVRSASHPWCCFSLLLCYLQDILALFLSGLVPSTSYIWCFFYLVWLDTFWKSSLVLRLSAGLVLRYHLQQIICSSSVTTSLEFGKSGYMQEAQGGAQEY
ncbi:hypothetical protein HMPREF1544_00114 [Mucor circinelloides 1006PhL]|uniref:Uncharacterized protein n=1 Tax=Mucor circinelloides f. circinelloides (strain 1006PhL) TaxID=1220926 RepID=S2KKW0_MUCC1|nr:hypothetical protein HMPREF1544_00114 [Mucor circinelloides 1006PhL]